VLLSADRIGTVEIMHRTGTSKTCVWRWQERFAGAGVEGPLRDKTRPSRVPPLGQEVIDKVVALTATEPQYEATHWTAAAVAKAVGISVSSVQRVWKAHGLAPHRMRRFKLSRDPDFVPRLRDVVGLYVDPPAHDVLDGTVLGRCMHRHRHQDFIRFLNAVEAAVPASKLVHAILDNYAAHKQPKVRAWPRRHPRWTFHFTPTSCSWLNGSRPSSLH
jgi:transposase